MADQGDAGGKVEKMKEIPVLFNGAMVRAIINDRKTQTRRPLPAVFNSPPSLVHGWLPPGWRLFGQEVPDHWGAQWYGTYPSMVRSPLGKPGDRLWVRETWCLNHPEYEHAKPPTPRPVRDDGRFAYYRATDDYVEFDEGAGWKPSIHMPRWAARLFLDVADVRIERLQDISEEDARAEGVEQCGGFMTTWGCWMNYGKSGPSCKTARESFQTLWISVYGAESWAANPWVWVTEFKRVT